MNTTASRQQNEHLENLFNALRPAEGLPLGDAARALAYPIILTAASTILHFMFQYMKLETPPAAMPYYSILTTIATVVTIAATAFSFLFSITEIIRMFSRHKKRVAEHTTTVAKLSAYIASMNNPDEKAAAHARLNASVDPNSPERSAIRAALFSTK